MQDLDPHVDTGNLRHRTSFAQKPRHSTYCDIGTVPGTRTDGRSCESERAKLCARCCAVKPAPKANRITGPKLFAAAIPTKLSLGTDDSKVVESTGIFPAMCTFDRISALRNFRRSRSTL